MKQNLTAIPPIDKSGHTSKGDQLKWLRNNTWYKADYMGYEGLSEVVVSHLLKKSTAPYSFVLYDPVQIEYHEHIYQGCSSTNFLNEEQMLIPIEKLYRQFTSESLAEKLASISDEKERIRYTVDTVQQITGIPDFGAYLTEMLEIDAFFLNEDRHTNNIAVIYDDIAQEYALCPIFDHGLCLLADITTDYPLGSPIESCLQKITAKPFSVDFDKQLDAAEELYGVQLHLDFTIQDVCQELTELRDQYSDETLERVEQLLRRQIRKYSYLMH